MTSKIMVISPDSDMHAQLTGSLNATRKRRHATTALYNDVAEAYNHCEIDGFVVVEIEVEDKENTPKYIKEAWGYLQTMLDAIS